MTSKPKRRAPVDWEGIEREYRAGQLSVRVIGAQFGVTDTAIRKRAKVRGWKRDLTDDVRRETRARLMEEGAASSHDGSHLPRANEAEIIDAAASRGVAVVREHRKALGRTRMFAMRMLDELETITTHEGELVRMIEAETAGDQSPQRRNAMLRAVQLPSRVAMVRELSMALKNTIPLERQAHGLDDDKGDDATSLAALIAASYEPDASSGAGLIIEHEP